MQASEIGCGHFSSDFSLRYRGADLGRFQLRVPGRHNVLNAMAAACVALELEVKPDAIREALATFSGVDRRFQLRGEDAASPWWTITAITPPRSAPRSMARAFADSARIHVLFQPHRYTRTLHLMDEFARAFHQADPYS